MTYPEPLAPGKLVTVKQFTNTTPTGQKTKKKSGTTAAAAAVCSIKIPTLQKKKRKASNVTVHDNTGHTRNKTRSHKPNADGWLWSTARPPKNEKSKIK